MQHVIVLQECCFNLTISIKTKLSWILAYIFALDRILVLFVLCFWLSTYENIYLAQSRGVYVLNIHVCTRYWYPCCLLWVYFSYHFIFCNPISWPVFQVHQGRQYSSKIKARYKLYETDDLAHIHQLRHLWAYSIVAAPDACADPAALAAKWAPAWAELRCSVDSAATTAGSDAALAAQWVQRIGGGVQWSFLAAIATALCATAWWAIWP